MNALPSFPFKCQSPCGHIKGVVPLVVVSLALLVGLPLGATTFTVTTSQNWSDFSPQPTSADAIVVRNGATLTVNIANGQCASIQLGVSGSGDGSLTFLSGQVVTCSGNVTLGQGTTDFGTISMSSGGTLQVGGALRSEEQ